jgi:hypothetical protein
MVLGGVVFAAGVFLFLGNVIGFFPTVPAAGWITMLIGGGLFGWGKKQAAQQPQGPPAAGA